MVLDKFAECHAEWQQITEDEYPTLLDLLEQDEVWGKPGDRTAIEDLSDAHLENVINYLRRNAASLKFAYEYAALRLPEPQGEMAQDMANSGFSDLLAQDAQEWLNEMPLMQRLIELQQSRSSNV